MSGGRELAWDGCWNVRDLGGLPVEGGGETRRGVAVRADSVRRLTPAGWAALVDYGVARIVDLRWHEELELDEPPAVAVELVHVPLLGAFDREAGAELNARLDAIEDTEEYFRFLYTEFLERHRANFAAAVTAVAESPGPCVVHCAAGKDRTGLVSALLLRLAGVAIESVAADYAVSNPFLIPKHRDWIEGSADEAQRHRRLRQSDAPAAAMAAVLEELDGRYGSARAYLAAAGVPDDLLEALRRRLVAKAEHP